MAELKGDYRRTKTYASSGKDLQKQYEAWKKDQKMDNDTMYLYLLRQDMRNLPKDVYRKGNSSIEMMVISAMLVFLAGTASRIRGLMLVGAVAVIITAALYFSGVMNPYYRTIRSCTKKLKAKPSFQDFEEWSKAEGKGGKRI